MHLQTGPEQFSTKDLFLIVADKGDFYVVNHVSSTDRYIRLSGSG